MRLSSETATGFFKSGSECLTEARKALSASAVSHRGGVERPRHGKRPIHAAVIPISGKNNTPHRKAIMVFFIGANDYVENFIGKASGLGEKSPMKYVVLIVRNLLGL